MGRGLVGLSATLCVVASCTGATVDPLGRPCSEAQRCGPGAYCHPVTHLCVAAAVVDLSADRPSVDLIPAGDRLGPGDSTGGELPGDLQTLDLGPADSRPSDLRLPDGAPPPCAGLTCPLGCNVSANRCNRLKPTNFVVYTF